MKCQVPFCSISSVAGGGSNDVAAKQKILNSDAKQLVYKYLKRLIKSEKHVKRKKIQLITSLVWVYTSQDCAQTQQKKLPSHNIKTVTFRNSVRLLALVTCDGWNVNNDKWHPTWAPNTWHTTHDSSFFFIIFFGASIFTHWEIQCLPNAVYCFIFL